MTFLTFDTPFSVITHTKSSKIVMLGELANSSPLAFAEGLFLFVVLFQEKKDFFNLLSY